MQLLTPRELEILQLLTYGHTNRQIAAAVGIATTDVIDIVAELRRKLGAHDRASLIAAWQRSGERRWGANTSDR